MKNKNILWNLRTSHLRNFLQDLPRRLRDDAKLIIDIFVIRKSLRLRLCDTYLEKLWEVSTRTVQRRLAQLEEVGLIRRFTQSPKRDGIKGWKQMRHLVLILPKSKNSSLVCHNEQQANLQAKPVVDSLTQAVKPRAKRSFVEYLTTQVTVTKSAFAYFVRSEGATERSIGHLLGNIYPLIKNRPDALESILWCARDEKLRGSKLIAFMVNQIHQQLGKYAL